MVIKNYSITLDKELVEKAKEKMYSEGKKLSPVINNLLQKWFDEQEIVNNLLQKWFDEQEIVEGEDGSTE